MLRKKRFDCVIRQSTFSLKTQSLNYYSVLAQPLLLCASSTIAEYSEHLLPSPPISFIDGCVNI